MSIKDSINKVRARAREETPTRRSGIRDLALDWTELPPRWYSIDRADAQYQLGGRPYTPRTKGRRGLWLTLAAIGGLFVPSPAIAFGLPILLLAAPFTAIAAVWWLRRQLQRAAGLWVYFRSGGAFHRIGPRAEQEEQWKEQLDDAFERDFKGLFDGARPGSVPRIWAPGQLFELDAMRIEKEYTKEQMRLGAPVLSRRGMLYLGLIAVSLIVLLVSQCVGVSAVPDPATVEEVLR